MENKQNKGGGLNKSLKLIFVYTVATGSIFTFVNYWDSVFTDTAEAVHSLHLH